MGSAHRAGGARPSSWGSRGPEGSMEADSQELCSQKPTGRRAKALGCREGLDTGCTP